LIKARLGRAFRFAEKSGYPRLKLFAIGPTFFFATFAHFDPFSKLLAGLIRKIVNSLTRVFILTAKRPSHLPPCFWRE